MSVNTMAGNLTTQVRGFAQISAAAMDGDFTRFITVEASGEMDSLKTQINQMVFNLRDSIQKNTAAREAAELANRSKSEFLANMSHEIRYETSVANNNVHRLLIWTKNANERHYWHDRADSRLGLEQITEGEFAISPLVGPLTITDHR